MIPTHMTPDLSVIILCYKAGRQVPNFVNRVKDSLDKRGISYELVLVGNYNAPEAKTDETPAVVRSLAEHDPTVVAVTEEKKGMFGWDVRSGLAKASGKVVGFIDGDGQMPAEDIVRLYDEMLVRDADMAQMFRVRRHDGLQRLFISRFYNALLRLLFPKVSVYDANAKPKLFRRAALGRLDLRADDWFIDAEIVIQAAYKGLSVAELPTVFHKNAHRSSFVKVRDLTTFFFNLVRYRLRGRVR